ncbi:salicylate carboxymethyltransferase-like [Prosopis cineraria]|uniref:salicylate carboxymethyltransferase-like n=1 Tax=Prosopis cineraria TaxID=364024 RepID=UPI00240EBBCF|nr:salicylate carboxymethyltransferase-like [Prosopis cineraria]
MGRGRNKGIIEEEEVDSFNIPQYTPSPFEVEEEVMKEGSFVINRIEVSSVTWINAYNNNDYWTEMDSDQFSTVSEAYVIQLS